MTGNKDLYIEGFAGYLVCGNEDRDLKEGEGGYTYSLLQVENYDTSESIDAS